MALIIWVMACEPPSGAKIAGRQLGPSATPLKGQAVGGDGGGAVPLTNIEYRLLSELSVNARRALTHDQLLQRVWGPDKGEDSGPVRNIVKRLRRKLGEDASNPASIFAVPRVGYRMEKGEEQEGA